MKKLLAYIIRLAKIDTQLHIEITVEDILKVIFMKRG